MSFHGLPFSDFLFQPFCFQAAFSKLYYIPASSSMRCTGEILPQMSFSWTPVPVPLRMLNMDANCVLNLIVAGREKVLQLFWSGFYGTVSLGSCCKLWNCLHINLARILFIPQLRNAFKLMESHGDIKPVRLVAGCPSHRFPPWLGWFPFS